MTASTLHFRVNATLCSRCGLCAEDCVSRIIRMEGTGLPSVPPEREEACINCQHCLAVCPEGALSIRGLDPARSRPLKDGAFPSFDQMDLLVRGRRSVRRYRDENVDPVLIRRLLESIEHAPTGVNIRRLRFTVVQDKAVLGELRNRMLAALLEALESGELARNSAYFAAQISLWRNEGRDVLFRGAPHLLLVSAPPDTPTATQDVALTLAYFELLAQSSGLGTVWLGFLRRALELIPALKALLDLPQDHVYYGMLFGHPAIRYPRTVQREGSASIHILGKVPA